MLRLKIIPNKSNKDELVEIVRKVSLLPNPEIKARAKLSKTIRTELLSAIKIALKYLFAKDVHARIPLYLLFSDKIKIDSLDNYYVWNSNSALWIQKPKAKLKDTDLLYVMDETFKIYRRIIKELDISEVYETDCIWKKEEIISLLDEQLIYSKSKSHKIVDQYIEQMLDDTFVNKLDPRNFLAVQGKKVIDLTNGIVRDRTINDFCTREIPLMYNPTAKSDLLDKVLSEICLYDKDMVNLIERIFGYAITGMIREGLIFIFQGESLAGKSILINLLHDTLGSGYSTYLNKNIVIGKKKDDNGTDPFVHVLSGRRVGIVNETDEDDTINPGKTKLVATNEAFSYRLLHSNYVHTVASLHTLILSTNNRTKLPETDESIWRRLMLIPFSAKFVENPSNENEFPIDKDLREKLKDPLIKQAFLTKIVNAAIKYNKEGLGKIPEKVTRAIKKYRKDTDVIQQFIKEFLIKTNDKKDTLGATILLNKFKEETRIDITQRSFGSKIKAFLGESEKNGAGLKEYRFVKWKHDIANI